MKIPQSLLTTTITGEQDGLPKFEGVVLRVDEKGKVRAYLDGGRSPWGDIEFKDIPAADMKVIQAIHDKKTDTLTAEQKALLAAAQDEEVKEQRKAEYQALDSESMDALETWAKKNNVPEFATWLAKKQAIKDKIPKAVEVTLGK